MRRFICTNKVNEGVIIYYSNRYGLYLGELSNAILNTHIAYCTAVK
ncbi:hypothetical protein ACFQZX_14940 [Mucilaginibacter litoreus]|uniref:Uncharacterized protein n=1 Tax=Mucilaginibacter litoreus TaxID=1048221 RepID=A0ABW3AV19_9SPHI